MPQAFKFSPNHPAVGYLVRLHADLGGQIWEKKKEAERLAESMTASFSVVNTCVLVLPLRSRMATTTLR